MSATRFAAVNLSENVYLETSLNLTTLIRSAAELRPDRVIFGSGSPRSSMACELKKMFEAVPDETAREQILHPQPGAAAGRARMIIDTHTHLLDGDWLCAFSGLPTAEALIAAQERFGVSQMWMSSTGALADDFSFYNRQMHEITRAYPGTLPLLCFGKPLSRGSGD